MTLNNDTMWGTTRIRLRRSDQGKANLEKHFSLPELRLPPEESPQFHCRECGFVNTPIPLCLWCTWSSQEGEHAFKVSIPRARHVSTPLRAFQLEQPPKSKYTHAHDHTPPSSPTTSLSAAHGKQPQIRKPSSTRRKSRGLFADPPSFVAHSISEAVAAPATTSPDRDMNSHDDGQMGTKEGDITGRPPLVSRRVDEDNVATATPSVHLYSASAVCEEQEALSDPLLDLSPLLPSEDKVSPSVDRSMISSTPSLTQNPSPRLLFIDLHDMRTDDDQLSNLVMLNDNDIKPSTLSPRPQELRSLRRRKHLNVLQTSPSDLAGREPIPISLKIRSSASKTSLKLKPISSAQDSTHIRDRSSQQISVRTDSSNGSPVTPETPMLLQISPSTSPTRLSINDVSSSPVRLGHPSRPYYTAIRKQGVSPTSPTPSSRPSSMVGPPASLVAPRRQSYTPSTTMTLPVMSTTASRHLSMSTMFCSPAYSLPSENGFSVFSLQDDENADAGGGDDDEMQPTLPPSPPPNTTRFSFPRRAKDAHHISLEHSIHGGGGDPNTQAQSLSYSRRSGYRGSGVGFSMSGQTELRMALAEDGFRFRETAPLAAAPAALVDGDGDDAELGHGLGGRRLGVRTGRVNAKGGMDVGEKNSFMARVRKLRKGLRDMLLMASTTTS